MINIEDITKEYRRFYRKIQFENDFDSSRSGTWTFDGVLYNKRDYKEVIKMLDELKDEEILYATMYRDGGSMMLRTSEYEIVFQIGEDIFKKHYGRIKQYKPFALVRELD